MAAEKVTSTKMRGNKKCWIHFYSSLQFDSTSRAITFLQKTFRRMTFSLKTKKNGYFNLTLNATHNSTSSIRTSLSTKKFKFTTEEIFIKEFFLLQ